MEDLNDKITGGNLTATEWNQVPSELQNVITQTGQSLTNADLNQLGKGIAEYAANGEFYTDSGAANAYVLTQIGTKQAPTSYVDGLVIRFIPGNTNTSASTVNVAALGVKTIVNFDGSALIDSEIVSGDPVRSFFDSSNDRFQLLLEMGTNNYSLLRTGRKNALINGGFDVAERATSTTVNGYFIDRFKVQLVGSTGTFTQVNHTFGQTEVPQEPKFFERTAFTGGAGAGDLVLMSQFIEDVRTLAGEQITVSFWARSTTSLDISTELIQNFGGGGSASVQAIGVNKTTLSTGFTKISNTFIVPSISGKTIGSFSSLQFIFWFSAGSSFNARTSSLGQQSGQISISNVQVERGASATDFEKLTFDETFMMCLRYFEKFTYGVSDLVSVAQAISTTTISGVIYYHEKLLPPSISHPESQIRATSANGGNAGGIFSASSIGFEHARITITSAGSLVVGDASSFLAIATATIRFDSEF